MKKKNIILLIIAIVMFILVGSTMAYFGWSSSAENKDQLVDVTVSGGTGSCDKLSDNNKLLYPTSTREKGRILKVTTKQQMATNAFVTWNLVVNSINETTLTTSGLKHKSFKYELVNDTTGVSYGTGNFENVTNGTTITLSTDKETLDFNKEYTFILYLWIDGTIGNNPLDMTNQPYDFDLNCSITGTDTKITPPAPSKLSQYIKYLYDNADKTQVTNNNIIYNTAPSVRLMNDRLGGTTTSLDGGNIRYYGITSDIKQISYAWQSRETGSFFSYAFIQMEVSNPYELLLQAISSESNCIGTISQITDCSSNYSALGFSNTTECEAGLPTLISQLTEGTMSSVNELKQHYCTNVKNIIEPGTLNNYIYFNCSDYSNQSSSTCEVWRIVGVFDGKVKIIRSSIIGNLSWDYDKNDDGTSTTFDNNWSTATLQKLLNESYYNGIGTITYYNDNSTSVDLNMSNIGIKNDITRNMIAEVAWNIGSANTTGFVNNIYSEEITATWIGRLSLLTASEYVYAGDLLCDLSPSDYIDIPFTCVDNNWTTTIITNNNSNNGWLITPTSDNSNDAWNVDSSGHLYSSGSTYNAFGVAPVLYLNSELEIESGDGSSESPYKLKW